MSGPKLRFHDGREEEQDSGITLSDIRVSHPGCYLLNGSRAHRLDAFVLQDGVTYELVQMPISDARAAAAPMGPMQGKFILWFKSATFPVTNNVDWLPEF